MNLFAALIVVSILAMACNRQILSHALAGFVCGAGLGWQEPESCSRCNSEVANAGEIISLQQIAGGTLCFI